MTALDGDSRVPVHVLTGFLGAGKTTLLRRLVHTPALRNAAVIINEFGAIGLDHDLIEASDEQSVTLASGCLCCTIRGDLARTLHQLYQDRARARIREFDRVVIETTGLADPAPILQTLITDPLIAAVYRLAGVVTVVDGVAGGATLDAQPEAVKQAAVADRLVLTKRDLAEPRAYAALCGRLARLNPGARLIEAAHGVVDPATLLDTGPWSPDGRPAEIGAWLGEPPPAHDHAPHHEHHHRHDPNRHDARIRAFTLRRAEPVPAAALSLFLDLLTAQRGADLLRMKGIVQVAETPDRPLVLHAVQHVVHEPIELDAWPSADRDTRIVVIGRDLDPEQVRGLFDALATGFAAKLPAA